MSKRYIIEVRNEKGQLDFDKQEQKEKEHPYLFSNKTFNIDNLCYYMSYGQDRNTPKGPMDLPEFMSSIGICFREKTW